MLASCPSTKQDGSLENFDWPTGKYQGDQKAFINKVRMRSASKICSTPRGMAFECRIQTLHYELNLSARIWKGGCIIRAGFLNKIKDLTKIVGC